MRRPFKEHADIRTHREREISLCVFQANYTSWNIRYLAYARDLFSFTWRNHFYNLTICIILWIFYHLFSAVLNVPMIYLLEIADKDCSYIIWKTEVDFKEASALSRGTERHRMFVLATGGPGLGDEGVWLRSRIRGKSVVKLARRGSRRNLYACVCVDAGNTIFMLMPRASGSVFKLCKSNINAKPVINNLSASRGVTRGGRGDGRNKRRRAKV